MSSSGKTGFESRINIYKTAHYFRSMSKENHIIPICLLCLINILVDTTDCYYR